MDFLLGIGNTVLGMIFGYTVVPVYHQVGNIFDYITNVANLEGVVKRLKAHKDAMQERVNQANRENVEEILAHVEKWMEDLHGVLEEADEFLRDVESYAEASFFFRFLPNLIRRHQLSSRAKNMVGSLVHFENRGHFDQVSYRPHLQSYVQNKGYKDFGSRKLTTNEVMKALKDPNTSTVGVFGMPGIGKTTFAKEIARRALDEKLFDQAIVVVVSHVPNRENNIQQEIADLLGMILKETTSQARADKLRCRLRKENKILITLDDIWNKLELHDVGISFGSHQKGCKILLTSRFENVVRNDMEAESFKLDLLSHNEASSLFNKMVGDSARELDLQLIAEKIIEECACLPISIVVVAAALKNKPSYYWEDALHALQNSSPISIGEMGQDFYKSIRLSYNFLARNDARYLLLLCSLHQEDENINVEDLVEYGMGLNLFQGITKLKDARNRVRTLVYDLKDACLLLDGKNENSVKIHDVIRYVCLSIASQDEHMHFIGDIPELVQCILKKKLVDAIAISLPSVDINQLCERLKFPQLKLLLIRHIGKTLMLKGSLDEQFFEEMEGLRVLSLRNVEIKLTCFSQLQNLQTLCLRSCNVGDITPIGELKKLEILNLERSDILKVPREIGKLTLLRSLVLANCYNIYHVEPHAISSLKNLEHLNMEKSFSRWNAIGVEGEISNVSPVELNDLAQLTSLSLFIPDVSSLPEIWIKTNLERHQIIIGNWPKYSNDKWDLLYNQKRTTSKKLKLKLEKSHLMKERGIENLMKGTEELCLDGLKDVNDVFELDKDGFPHLEHFLFQNNESIQYITNSSDPCSAFLNLKSMFLRNMMNLEKICQGKLIAGSFGKLKKVVVRKCDGINRLFSFSIAKQFEEIEVWDCPALKEIVTGHESEYESSNANIEALDETKFFQLVTLKLNGLPNVTQFFWSKIDTISMHERGECWLMIVDSPMPFFSDKVHMPNLQNLEMESLGCRQIWNHQLVSGFKKLSTLKVARCPHLKNLMSYSMVINLGSLRYLEVSNCEEMEEIISMLEESEKEESLDLITFHKLEILIIKDIPKLRRFSAANGVICPSLSSLTLINCLDLTTFVNIFAQAPTKHTFFGGKVMIPTLKYAEIGHSEIINEIFNLEGESSVNSFGKLKELHLECSSQDESVVLPFQVSQRFQNLDYFSMHGLSAEKLFQHQELSSSEENDNILPHLRTLVLKKVVIVGCDRLKSFIPPSVSFQCLTTLRVSKCSGPMNLFASSVVKGLVNLSMMSINECESMTEIVENDEVFSEKEIVFEKLVTLKLHDLPNLRCFYSGNRTLIFPKLKTLKVQYCPEMQAFSHGFVNSPIVNMIITESKSREHNINATIRNPPKRREERGQL